ncbi:MAG: aspartate-semialdehyde dehydrogenase [Candidatus Dormibacteraeota bacterium]|jgi:aspartate-semialdehyde dehydrogenase|nr:aspartate-semialdehyde dehydrogenase [Candidatus Dormibacteraeota bacterium]
MTAKIPVAILGATGAVGQQMVAMLDGHPWFELTELVASDRSAGQAYGEVVDWRLEGSPPERAGRLQVQSLERLPRSRLLLSALDSRVAAEAESQLAREGYAVVSNSSSHRMDPEVPLVIPEANASHLEALAAARTPAGGFIVTNPNCSTIGLVVALKPLWDRFGIAEVQVTTLQAISGAGLDGVSGGAITDNVVPYIAGEEEKLESEPLKILGRWESRFVPAELVLSATCHRVPVLHGHLEAVSVRLKSSVGLDEVREALVGFRAEPDVAGLPSSPATPIRVHAAPDRPQPRLDRGEGAGMTVTVGRLRPCSVLDWKFVVLSHNLIRGAAGAALLNAELLVARGEIGRD